MRSDSIENQELQAQVTRKHYHGPRTTADKINDLTRQINLLESMMLTELTSNHKFFKWNKRFNLSNSQEGVRQNRIETKRTKIINQATFWLNCKKNKNTLIHTEIAEVYIKRLGRVRREHQ